MCNIGNEMSIEMLNFAFNEFSIQKSRESIKAWTKSKVELELSKYAMKLISLMTLLLKDNPKNEYLSIEMKCIEGFLGQKGSKTRQDILRAFKELKNTTYEVYKDKILIGEYQYISDYHYDNSSHTINIRLDLASVSFLFDTSGSFAKLVWLYTFGMKSKYGQKLYELVVLEQYRKDRTIMLTTTEFKEILGIQNKYPNIAHLKTFVIDSGVKDINEYTPFNIKYEANKFFVKFFISNKNHEEVQKITEQLRSNKQIKEIIESYEYLKYHADIKMTADEYNLSKTELLSQTDHLIGKTENNRLIDSASINYSLSYQED